MEASARQLEMSESNEDKVRRRQLQRLSDIFFQMSVGLKKSLDFLTKQLQIATCNIGEVLGRSDGSETKDSLEFLHSNR